ncbi:MAG: hypothetical protein ACT4OP_11505 [Actinomycetota bacterium]
MTVIRAVLVQSEWTGDKESMVEKKPANAYRAFYRDTRPDIYDESAR